MRSRLIERLQEYYPSQRRCATDLRKRSEIVIINLVAYFYANNKDTRNEITDCIYKVLHEIPYIKSLKRYPYRHFIMKHTYRTYKDIFTNWLSISDENLQVEDIQEFIRQYFLCLSIKLSTKGRITRFVVDGILKAYIATPDKVRGYDI